MNEYIPAFVLVWSTLVLETPWFGSKYNLTEGFSWTAGLHPASVSNPRGPVINGHINNKLAD